MIQNIHILIKTIAIQLNQNFLLTKVILICFFLFFLIILKYYSKKKKAEITIENLHINHISDNILFITLFFCLYILGMFYLRFCNFGKSLDLKEIFFNLISFFVYETINYIIITLLYNILFVIVIIIFIIKLMKSIKLNLFKIHIYIISCYPLGFFQITPYTKFTSKFEAFYTLFSGVFYYLYRNLLKIISKYILKKEYNYYNTNKITNYLYKIRDKNALFILIILIFYDIIFNNFVLTKMYYFIPIVFLYNLVKLINDIFSIYEPFEEGLIVSHLYFNVESLDIKTNNIVYVNNFEGTIQDLKNIEIKLNQEFNTRL